MVKDLNYYEDGNYEGEWENGKPNGKGCYKARDGEKFEGRFLDGEFHGQGVLSFPDGVVYEGEWKQGQPWNIIGYNKDREIIVKYAEGEGHLW